MTVYTSGTLDYMQDLTKGFSDEYDIDVSLYKSSNGALAQRLDEEHKAGFHGADIVEDNAPEMIGLEDTALIVPYHSPAVAGLVPGAEGKSWIGDKFNTFVTAWNTKRVAKGEEPHSIDRARRSPLEGQDRARGRRFRLVQGRLGATRQGREDARPRPIRSSPRSRRTPSSSRATRCWHSSRPLVSSTSLRTSTCTRSES